MRSVPLLNLIKILSSLYSNVYVVSSKESVENSSFSDNTLLIDVCHKSSSKMLTRIINYISTQININQKLISVSKKVDLFVFFLGGENLIPSILSLKILRKRILILIGGTPKGMDFDKTDFLLAYLTKLTDIAFESADKLIVYSKKIVQAGQISKYSNKIIIAHEHFVDFKHFTPLKNNNKKSKIVGYVGRFNPEKGVLNFIQAIPKVIAQDSSISFSIVGTGPLESRIKQLINNQNFNNKVRLIGWIPHQKLPYYLNEIDLLVLPSFTEGLPNILLEAMACGTPILATNVGAISSVISEGETGFLLESNNPENIANRIIDLFSNPDLLEKVRINSQCYVRDNYSFQKTSNIWLKLSQSLF